MKRIGAFGTLALALLAQDAKIQFEVASVRPSGPVTPGTPQFPGGRITGGPGTNDPERIAYDRVPLQQLLMAAYNVQRDQIKGPDWATTDDIRAAARYDISAKIPPGAPKDQVAVMLQNLLAERFQLRLHHEAVEVSGFNLVAAKGGAKVKESSGPIESSERAVAGAGGRVDLAIQKDGFPQVFPGANMGGMFRDGVVRMRFRDYPMYDLSQQLAIGLGAHVADKTGLSGRYDFTLQVDLADGFLVAVRLTLPIASGKAAPLSKTPPDPVQQDAVPVISAAMEKQLGLKLEAAKISVDTLVIDHVERTPSEN